MNANAISDFLKITDNRTPLVLFAEISSKCNLTCRFNSQAFCYYYKDSSTDSFFDLTIEEWIEKLKQIKKENPSLLLLVLLGGEPLLRKDLVQRIIDEKIFLWNIVVTNGTFPLDVKGRNFHYVIGMNGTEMHHDKIRTYANSQKGSYDIIKKNLEKAERKKVILHPIINAMNISCIKDFAEEWKDYSINFGFYVPQKGEESDFVLSDEQRNRAVDIILKLKKKYSNIVQADSDLTVLKNENRHLAIDSNCLYKTGAFITFDSGGQRKYPCPSQGDCNRCSGSGIGFSLIDMNDAENIRIISKLLK